MEERRHVVRLGIFPYEDHLLALFAKRLGTRHVKDGDATCRSRRRPDAGRKRLVLGVRVNPAVQDLLKALRVDALKRCRLAYQPFMKEVD